MGSRARPAQPTLSDTIALSKNDIILLCSDGFWGQLPDKDLRTGFNNGDLTNTLDDLAHHAETRAYPRSDNISAIALRYISDAGQLNAPFDEQGFQTLSEGMEQIDKVLNESKKPA